MKLSLALGLWGKPGWFSAGLEGTLSVRGSAEVVGTRPALGGDIPPGHGGRAERDPLQSTHSFGSSGSLKRGGWNPGRKRPL